MKELSWDSLGSKRGAVRFWSTQMRRKAFTLIELLVVIAIISILAAILFPVFAQAKTAAKKAADLSNTKQLALGVQLYMDDTDDTLPVPFTNVEGGVCLPNDPGVCGETSMWQFHVYPYLKSWELFTSPVESKGSNPTQDAFNVSYGYNYGYLSTLCLPGEFYSMQKLGCPAQDPGDPSGTLSFSMAMSASSLNRPSQIVMFTSAGGKDFKDASIMGSLVNPPDAFASEKNFLMPAGSNQSGWGKDCQGYWSKGQGYVKSGAWGDTDGFAAKFNEVANVVYGDTHVKSNHVGSMASGTVWGPDLRCTTLIYVTDYSKYQWDPRYDSGVQRHW